MGSQVVFHSEGKVARLIFLKDAVQPTHQRSQPRASAVVRLSHRPRLLSTNNCKTHIDKAGLLNEMNYGKVMSLLRRAKKTKLLGQNWQLIKISPASETLLQKLSLLPNPEEPKKKEAGTT